MDLREIGVLFIGHGSRLPYNKEIINTIASKFSNRYPQLNVEVGFLELTTPSIPTAFNKLKSRGVKKIIVSPVFLSDGTHTKRDIPALLGVDLIIADLNELFLLSRVPARYNINLNNIVVESETTSTTKSYDNQSSKKNTINNNVLEFDGEINYLKPLGCDDKIVDIVVDRVNSQLNKNSDMNSDNTGVLLIGHGTRLPYGCEVMSGIANKFSKIYPDFDVEVGYMRMCEPSIQSSFNRLKKGKKYIIAVPIFLAEGIHTKMDIPCMLGLQPDEIPNYTNNNNVEDVVEFDGIIYYTEPLGADNKIVDLLVGRIAEYLE